MTSTINVNNIKDGSGGSNAQLYGVASPPNSMGFRNRIINGDMRIDERNNGSSVTPTDGAYTLDRWSARLSAASKFSVQRNAGAITAPAGFSNYLGVTSLSAYTAGTSEFFSVGQLVEGYNVADLGWGSASAQAVTLSFVVRSSLTGTFGGAIYNADGTRSYPFTYTVTAANTWETKSVTIPGDTTGTWNTTNGTGLSVNFGLGAGASVSGPAGAWSSVLYRSASGATSVVATNGATWYVTGVQLEAGTNQSPFERRDYGRELMLCQRYFWAPTSNGGNGTVGFGYTPTSAIARFLIPTPVTMRAAPTFANTASNTLLVQPGAVSYAFNSAEVVISGQGIATSISSSGFTGSNTSAIIIASPSNNPSFSAEL